MKKKKMNGKLISSIMTLVLICGLGTGCGSAMQAVDEVKSGKYGIETYNSSDTADIGMEYQMAKNADIEETMEAAGAESVVESDASENTTAVPNNQKIIKTYDYHFETEKFDNAYAHLNNQITTCNGYVSSMKIVQSDYASAYRTLHLTARIPVEQSTTFVSQLGELGTTISQSENAEDVTLQYSDTESRISSLKVEQKRLNELLEQADSLETIIALEERLTQVRYELENYESQKRLLDDRIAYSTISITMEEVKYTVEDDDGSFISRITIGLKRSLRDIGNDFVVFVEWLIIHLPYLLIWALVIFVIVKVIKKMNKNKRERRQKKEMQKQTDFQTKQVKANEKPEPVATDTDKEK